jgi:hypothetical protein
LNVNPQCGNGISCCPDGYILISGNSIIGPRCQRCNPGEIISNNTCVRCNIGEWSTYFTTVCNKCPPGMTTPNGSPGTSANDCVSQCASPTMPENASPNAWSINCSPCDIGSSITLKNKIDSLSTISGITADINVTGLSSTAGYTRNSYVGTISYDSNKHSCGDMAWLIQNIAINGLNCMVNGLSCTVSDTATATQNFIYNMARTAEYTVSGYCYSTSDQAVNAASIIRNTAQSGNYEIPLVKYNDLNGRICLTFDVIRQTTSSTPLDSTCISCQNQTYKWNKYNNFYACTPSQCCGINSSTSNPDTSIMYCPDTIQSIIRLSTENSPYVAVFEGTISTYRFPPFNDYCSKNPGLCHGSCQLGSSCSGQVPPPPSPTSSPIPTPSPEPEEESPEPEAESPEPEPEAESPESEPQAESPGPEPEPCLIEATPCGDAVNPGVGDSMPCSLAARQGTAGTCCQFDNGTPLVCLDQLCVPAFDPGTPNNCSCDGQVISTAPGRRLSAGVTSCPVPDPCNGLTTMKDPNLKSHQVVISDSFKNDIQDLLICAEVSGMKLIVQSTGRCDVPDSTGDPDIDPATDSDHRLGNAIDTNLRMSDGSFCKRDCMAAAYCAYHMDSNGCKKKFGNNPPPQTDRNALINDFLTCAGKNGLKVGATFKKPDWNHFQRGSFNQAAADAFKALLQKYCNKQCPNVSKGDPGLSACNCFK